MGKYFSKEKFRYPFYVLTHPMDGFYEIRHRERGSVLVALIIVALFSFSYSMNRILASFVVNNTDPREVDSYFELKGLFIFFFLFCIGNWSITCLMQGEGRLKDIIIAVGYSMLPLILTFVPATLLSRFIAADEEAFYYVILIVGIAWFAILTLIGIMTIHNYTLTKTILTLVLTFISMLIIVFILMMLSDLLTQVIGFFRNIYTELIFRT